MIYRSRAILPGSKLLASYSGIESWVLAPVAINGISNTVVMQCHGSETPVPGTGMSQLVGVLKSESHLADQLMQVV